MAIWLLSKKSETWRLNPQNKKKTFVIIYIKISMQIQNIYTFTQNILQLLNYLQKAEQ